MGTLLYLRSAASRALALYEQGAACDDDNPSLGRALYEQAIAIDPTLAVAYTNLGNLHFRLGHEIKATRLYMTALELEPNQPEALYNLGYMNLEAGLITEAIAFFRRASSADPKFADVWYNIGMAYRQAGLPDFAKRSFQHYLELAPNDEWSAQARAFVKEDQK